MLHINGKCTCDLLGISNSDAHAHWLILIQWGFLKTSDGVVTDVKPQLPYCLCGKGVGT